MSCEHCAYDILSLIWESTFMLVCVGANRWCCVMQHQLHSFMFAPSPSVESPGTPHSALPLPLNTVFPSSPLNGCDSASIPSPTLSTSSTQSASSSRHGYINMASVELPGSGSSAVEYGWYVVKPGCAWPRSMCCAVIVKSQWAMLLHMSEPVIMWNKA